jgi:hypothetical protein
VIYMIDAPTPFDSPATWRAYLLQVRALIREDPDSQQLKDEEAAALDAIENPVTLD